MSMSGKLALGEDKKSDRSLAARLTSWTARRRRRKLQRAAFRALLDIDDTILADIGVDRRVVERLACLPVPAETMLLMRTGRRL